MNLSFSERRIHCVRHCEPYMHGYCDQNSTFLLRNTRQALATAGGTSQHITRPQTLGAFMQNKKATAEATQSLVSCRVSFQDWGQGGPEPGVGGTTIWEKVKQENSTILHQWQKFGTQSFFQRSGHPSPTGTRQPDMKINLIFQTQLGFFFQHFANPPNCVSGIQRKTNVSSQK